MTYTSKTRELAKLAAQINNHKMVLSNYEKNPPQLPHEHKTRELSERLLRNLQAQHDSVLKND